MNGRLFFSFLTVLSVSWGYQTTSHASEPASQVVCLMVQDGVCRVVAPRIAIAVGFDPVKGESDLTLIAPSAEGYVESKKESVRTELETALIDGDLDLDDAQLIEAEMLARPEATYFIPSDVQLLLDDVGFPSTQQITPEEYAELLQVHMQLTMHVSAETAAFLVDRLGVEIQMPTLPDPILERVAAPTDLLDPMLNSKPVVIETDANPIAF